MSADKERVAVLENEVFQLKAFIKNMPGSIYWKNMEGKFLGRNQAAAELMYALGLEKTLDVDAVLGKDNYELFDKKTADHYHEADLEVLTQQKMVIKEESLHLQGGRVVTHLSIKRPFYNLKGELAGIIGNSIDITAHKAAEALRIEALISHEKMETMRLLAASIAHELRTPLGSIRMEAQNLLEMFPGLQEAYELAKSCGLPVKSIPMRRLKGIAEMIESIKDETVYANTIINMLLTNIQEPTVQQKDVEVLSMQACIKRAIERYPFVSEAQANLVHVDVSVDFEVNGVELLLEHLLFNLLRNSLYFIEAVGKGEIYIWLVKGKTENIMYFKDTGKGIPPDMVEKVFDRFMGTRHHGTGVGLAFCKEVMVEHRGTIACESVVGEYALFTLAFPLASTV